MKPDGAIPHLGRCGPAGQGCAVDGAWARERCGGSLGEGVMWTGARGVEGALSVGERWPGAVEMRVGGGGSEDGLYTEPPAASTSRRSWRVLRRRPPPDRN